MSASEETAEGGKTMNGKSLNELRDEATRIATEHGFTDSTPGEELMLIVSELAEALEDIRAGRKIDEMHYEPRHEDGVLVEHSFTTPLGPLTIDGKQRKPCGVPSEIADAIIRCLHFAGKHGIDIDRAVTEKMAFNATRPFRHGKKF